MWELVQPPLAPTTSRLYRTTWHPHSPLIFHGLLNPFYPRLDPATSFLVHCQHVTVSPLIRGRTISLGCFARRRATCPLSGLTHCLQSTIGWICALRYLRISRPCSAFPCRQYPAYCRRRCQLSLRVPRSATAAAIVSLSRSGRRSSWSDWTSFPQPSLVSDDRAWTTRAYLLADPAPWHAATIAAAHFLRYDRFLYMRAYYGNDSI